MSDPCTNPKSEKLEKVDANVIETVVAASLQNTKQKESCSGQFPQAKDCWLCMYIPAILTAHTMTRTLATTFLVSKTLPRQRVKMANRKKLLPPVKSVMWICKMREDQSGIHGGTTHLVELQYPGNEEAGELVAQGDQESD